MLHYPDGFVWFQIGILVVQQVHTYNICKQLFMQSIFASIQSWILDFTNQAFKYDFLLAIFSSDHMKNTLYTIYPNHSMLYDWVITNRTYQHMPTEPLCYIMKVPLNYLNTVCPGSSDPF